ncbi:putative monovalent cation/H+ antiporter subunit A [Marinimicrobium sp. ABcell2]|uniref:putative monovalent cation/H+ antiporter subunit A n=1 Tax=Marinimicrobium sp. ABcell2 TaxID=3069751 RepID=UPI0027B300C0|nr:putative monovalent cation/H+ antiporter subunit A [Marinimicrobium sp. ABcell2]MDQ2077721.1 putative monovalent cation/H+ antiporter subunit A [Marinimicrobium sp. ABcell2]
MLFAVFSGFVLAALTPWLIGLVKDRIGWLLALLPLGLTFYFVSHIPAVSNGEVILQSWDWMPGLDINLSFMLDGLSLMFALLISFIGTFILIYAGSYLRGHRYLGRFYVTMLCFMASMLGVVLSDNLISLFVFWELTSITSYLLIGFNHEDKDARKCALQGLLVTVGGGLALMAGLIMLGMAGGSFELSEILNSDNDLLTSSFTVGMILCILAGTFTKSAQFPFHFWLPNAMAAPTPVSAYLHSATMVKAGVYLMARLNPGLGEHPLWTALLCSAGAVTMVLGAYLAYSATGVKKVLAYSTIMALGTLTMLIGIGTDHAMIAFATFLLAHSLYKGALFMIAGILDHETGTKDLTVMGGLRSAMPITAVAATVAGLSLAGMPPLFGFVAKEALFEAVLGAPWQGAVLIVAAVASAILVIAVAGAIAVKPFWGALGNTPKKPHEAPIGMLLGPIVLAFTSLLFGVVLYAPDTLLVAAAVTSVKGAPVDFYLSLWHGVNWPLILSIGSVVAGVTLYLLWNANRRILIKVNGAVSRFGPEAGYFKMMDGFVGIANWHTRVLQNGVMGNYMIVLVMTTVILTGYTLLSQHGFYLALNLSDMNFYEGAIALLLTIAAIYVILTRSRLGAVATLGVLGFSVALIFILFSAPDLGITQVLVETLTVILLVLVLFKLPGFSHYSTRFEIWRDGTVAVFFGVLMTLLVHAAIDVRYFESISSYFVQASYPDAQGRNIVNVILVDFRALDTLGELFVLAIAALGVFSMLNLRAEVKKS